MTDFTISGHAPVASLPPISSPSNILSPSSLSNHNQQFNAVPTPTINKKER